MSMLHTIQTSGVPARLLDVTVDDTPLDGETSGYTYDWHDMPQNKVFALGEEANAVEVYFAGWNTTDNFPFSVKLYGYCARGPAEFIADISGKAGLARINDSTHNLFVDTLIFSDREHIKGCSISDSGNDRIAKLALDCVGYKYLYFEFYDVSAGQNAYIRPF